MVRKIDNQEIMTRDKAARKYCDSNFVFIITEEENCNDYEIKGYVIYTYDNPSELSQIPQEDLEDKHFGLLHGYAADPYPQVGGVYYG